MLFVRGLKPEVKTSVGVNVPEGLEDAISWAQRVDLWQSREGAGQESEKSGKRKQKGKLSVVSGEPGLSAGGQVVVVQGAVPQNAGGQREKGGGKGK